MDSACFMVPRNSYAAMNCESAAIADSFTSFSRYACDAISVFSNCGGMSTRSTTCTTLEPTAMSPAMIRALKGSSSERSRMERMR